MLKNEIKMPPANYSIFGRSGTDPTHVGTHLVVVVVIVVLFFLWLGRPPSKKPSYSSLFQIGSGWNLTRMFLMKVNTHLLTKSDFATWRHTFNIAAMSHFIQKRSAIWGTLLHVHPA